MADSICGNHECNENEVFVDVDDGKRDWEIVSKDKIGDRIVIECTYCEEPAIVLDAYYPYLTDWNRCAKHRGA